MNAVPRRHIVAATLWLFAAGQFLAETAMAIGTPDDQVVSDRVVSFGVDPKVFGIWVLVIAAAIVSVFFRRASK